MDKIDIDKIKKVIQDSNEVNKKFESIDSKVYKSFLNLERVAFSDGKLKKMYMELIAIGISVIINCESCMEWYIK